jgi:hypothetical protein
MMGNDGNNADENNTATDINTAIQTTGNDADNNNAATDINAMMQTTHNGLQCR